MKRNGFTLVETLVAIALFSILVAIGVGGFANALHTQRQVAALISAQTNGSIALEQMAREIRTGYLFCNTITGAADPTCATNVFGPGTGCTVAVTANGRVLTCNDIIDFYNAEGNNVDYELQNNALERTINGQNGLVPITSDNVAVKYLTFVIFGNTEGDHWNPRITISMGVSPTSNDPALVSDVVSLQTTISAREIDCTQSPVSC